MRLCAAVAIANVSLSGPITAMNGAMRLAFRCLDAQTGQKVALHLSTATTYRNREKDDARL